MTHDIVLRAFRNLDDAQDAWRRQSDEPFRIAEHNMPVPHDAMWLDRDALVLGATQDLMALLPSYDEEALADHSLRDMNRNYMRNYLYQTNVRVVNLLDALRDSGVKPGARILEVGSFFGSFSLSLQRSGYAVTAMDRYDEFKGRFDAYTSLMANEGVNVIRATRDTEAAETERLPQFDVVIAMAVIEHIPHTPKQFLEALLSKVRPGGLLVIDTPNVARWWNRIYLNSGRTIFQDLEQQFDGAPPWEGHHREFTADEVRWMLERVGCRDVQVRRFDYNMLQFAEIDRKHIDCLEACINDPGIGDTILAYGRR